MNQVYNRYKWILYLKYYIKQIKQSNEYTQTASVEREPKTKRNKNKIPIWRKTVAQMAQQQSEITLQMDGIAKATSRPSTSKCSKSGAMKETENTFGKHKHKQNCNKQTQKKLNWNTK